MATHFGKRQQGAEILEFLITLPVIIIVFFLFVEFAIALMARAKVVDASRVAARTAAAIAAPMVCDGAACDDNGDCCACGCDVGSGAFDSNLKWCSAYNEALAILKPGGDLSAPLDWGSTGDPTVCIWQQNQRVTVAVTSPFQVSIPFLPQIAVIDLPGSTTMSVLAE